MDEKTITPEKLNTQLMEAMRKRVADGANLANVLAEVLSLGKEAIYRRFRGEVPFTLAEAVTISRKLGISLDHLTGTSVAGESRLDFHIYKYDNPVDVYYSTLEYYNHLFQNYQGRNNSEYWNTSSRIPYGVLLHYEHLAEYHLLKWLYQHDAIDHTHEYWSIDALDKTLNVAEKQQELAYTYNQFDRNVLIWSEKVIQVVVDDLIYFRELGAFSPEKIKALKEELLDVVDRLTEIARTGKISSGKDVQLYISSLDLESNISYIEAGQDHLSIIRLYEFNAITSVDDNIFSSLKQWVKSLRKFSTLISESAEIQRFRFFRKQREYIQKL